MNYSTLKKTAALSIVSLMAVGAASAQTSSDSTAKTSAKIFGGSKQYRTWNIGVNVGVTSPYLPFGSNHYNTWDPGIGYGISVRKQLAHSFGLQADVMLPGSYVKGEQQNSAGALIPVNAAGVTSSKTTFAFAATLSGKVNVATVDFLARKNSVNFYVSAGAGFAEYNMVLTTNKPAPNDQIDGKTRRGNSYTAPEIIIPIG